MIKYSVGLTCFLARGENSVKVDTEVLLEGKLCSVPRLFFLSKQLEARYS